MPKTPPFQLPVPVDYPEDAVVVSFSEIDTYRQCPLKHVLAYGQRWSKTPEDGSPLRLGGLWHLVQETHYNSLKDDDDAGRKRSLARAGDLVSDHLFDSNGGQTDDQVLVAWMYEGYVEHHGTDEQWDILAVEYKLAEWLPLPDGGDSDYVIKGKLDLIVRDRKTGKIWIVDHKSGQNLPSMFELDIDDQFGIYTWLMQRRGLRIMGAIHNAARTTRNKGDMDGPPPPGTKKQTLEQRMHRTLLTRSKTELDNVIRDAWAVAENIYFTGTGERPLYSAPDPRQCGWKCDYKEAHLMARKGRDFASVLTEFGFHQNYERH